MPCRVGCHAVWGTMSCGVRKRQDGPSAYWAESDAQCNPPVGYPSGMFALDGLFAASGARRSQSRKAERRRERPGLWAPLGARPAGDAAGPQPLVKATPSRLPRPSRPGRLARRLRLGSVEALAGVGEHCAQARASPPGGGNVPRITAGSCGLHTKVQVVECQ